MFSHLRCQLTVRGSLAGFIHSVSSFTMALCILVRMCPMFSFPWRCRASSEMTVCRKRDVIFPSQSPNSLCISSLSSSRGNPDSTDVTQTVCSDTCCWWMRRRRSSLGVSMMSPSVGNRGSCGFLGQFLFVDVCFYCHLMDVGVSVGSGETGSRCAMGTSSSTWSSMYIYIYTHTHILLNTVSIY